MTNNTDKYDFSFTASSLRLNEMLLVCKSIIENKELDVVNDLGGGKSSHFIFEDSNLSRSILGYESKKIFLSGNIILKVYMRKLLKFMLLQSILQSFISIANSSCRLRRAFFAKSISLSFNE